MADVQCTRCGNAAAGLDKAPFPGDLGRLVHAGTCAACWREWLSAQVILINEHRLDGANPDHVQQLMGQMRTFLNLEEEK